MPKLTAIPKINRPREKLVAKQENKPIKYFKVADSKEIKEISKEEVEFESDLPKEALSIIEPSKSEELIEK